jgi:hypothetical protein
LNIGLRIEAALVCRGIAAPGREEHSLFNTFCVIASISLLRRAADHYSLPFHRLQLRKQVFAFLPTVLMKKASKQDQKYIAMFNIFP